MKEHLTSLLQQALGALCHQQLLPAESCEIAVQVEASRDPQHGEFASNLAMVLAKSAGKPPRALAELLVNHLPHSPQIAKVAIAGPGFINFTLTAAALEQTVSAILLAENHYGWRTLGTGQNIHLEYVSANPTGPLHVGHGRSAAYAACVANLLKAMGFQVHQEYYVNDAGRQMRILGFSTWLRYLQSFGESVDFPKNAYQGDYITDIANLLREQYNSRFQKSALTAAKAAAKKYDPETDADRYIDAYIDEAMTLLGKEDFNLIQKFTLQDILADIKDDLIEFGVVYDDWFLETQLFETGLVEAGIELLRKHDHVYERDGATWFRATDFQDEKDRVLIRENGITTYFASDVAYHLHKYRRDYTKMINVFGADHHGYVARIHSVLQGLGEDPDKLTVILVQFANLYRGKVKLPMSTRSGSFVTLRELRNEVGNDAARYFYIMRKPDQHLDFDLELAKSQSTDNPVYYIQYAHARICSVWKQLAAANERWSKDEGLQQLHLLTTNIERQLLRHLANYPDLLQNAALRYEPHLLAHYLQELAGLLHGYYNSEKFLVSDLDLRHARLCLVRTVQIVLAGGLNLLGISAPEQM
jgi:arginyl-tRNA synthetase